MSEMVTLECAYGPLKANTEYAMLNEGYDFVTLKYSGKSIHVPKNLIMRAKYHSERKPGDFLPSYEEIIEAEDI